MSTAEAQKYKSWVEIDLDSFRHNGEEIRRLIGPRARMLQVVKADAYGHGAIEISKFALKNGVSCLGVANADEGVQLRVSGIDAPILILSPSTASEINEIVKYNLTPSVSDVDFARKLDERFGKEGREIAVHIEVDTGMGRGGTFHSEAVDTIREIYNLPNVRVEGIFSHLSLSEEEEDEYNKRQWKLFKEVLERLEKEGIEIPVKHFSNSGAILNFSDYNMDMVRPGIMTYGIYPSLLTEEKANLLPVMSFKTSVVLLKEFPEGYNIGYGKAYITTKPTTIATIPVGYGDGYGFILSNQGEALIRGKRAPLVGRISMDMCTIDVSHIPECRVGDEVVLLGKQGDEYISANEIAEKAQTISYEILCALGKRAPRVFVNKGKADAIEPRLRRIFIPDEEKSIARIDNIMRSCLRARTSSTELGDAIYYEMFEALFGKENRRLELRTGFKYNIEVAEFAVDEAFEDYFRIKTHIEYIKTLRNDLFIIGCALNNDQLSALFEEELCEYRWLLNGPGDLFRENAFKVDCVRIDNEKVPIIKSENTERGFEVLCGGDQLKEKLNRPVKIEIEIVTMKSRRSNILSVYLVYPTRGLEVSFNYGGVDLKNVREISFFSGKHPYPEVKKEWGRSISLKISDDEWVFPTSGVTFIWD
ncbi:MAG: alanine racemase [Deltaproteobacteria bacterium]|nr:alanine racemase [Deltaproteobacteria bacterium]MBN2844486.1 alanine racemase [Deltaproteobacteria bacterium]